MISLEADESSPRCVFWSNPQTGGGGVDGTNAPLAAHPSIEPDMHYPSPEGRHWSVRCMPERLALWELISHVFLLCYQCFTKRSFRWHQVLYGRFSSEMLAFRGEAHVRNHGDVAWTMALTVLA
jgi:hypothetical protein